VIAASHLDDEHSRLVDELRGARDLIVQLQRELERAREVIAEQRASVRRAFGSDGKGSRR
jgi:hypothetical protein